MGIRQIIYVSALLPIHSLLLCRWDASALLLSRQMAVRYFNSVEKQVSFQLSVPKAEGGVLKLASLSFKALPGNK